MSEESQLQFRLERQLNPVADEVAAIVAVTRPILEATLYALKADVVGEVGGYDEVKLRMLPRLYRKGDGDCGICFEWAVHDAVNSGNPMVLNRVTDAMRGFCNIQASDPASILFGAEKDGTLQLVDTAKRYLTNDSTLLYGSQGRPVKLRKHIEGVAAAFRKPDAREALPKSIRGLWKADLFLGDNKQDRWVGTTVKINPRQLEGARGLRIGIVPANQGGVGDRIELDESRNLVVCPLLHDGAFMEVFYRGWQVVQQIIARDANMPHPVELPNPAERRVATQLVERRDFTVVDVVEALEPLAQPYLLTTEVHEQEITERIVPGTNTGAVVSPVAQETT